MSGKVCPADSEKINDNIMLNTGSENSCDLIPALNRYVIPSIDISIGHITKVVAMDHHSNSLMISDSAGYVSVYNIDESLDIEECDEINNNNNTSDEKVSLAAGNLNNSRELFYQAYKVEFDSLKSVEIEAKINCLCSTSIYTQNSYSYLLANDKSIRLFRANNKSHIYNRQIYKEKLLRKFDCHQFNINSVSASTNQLNFLSADDLNIHLWDYERSKIAYGISFVLFSLK
ncbi:MAG: protein phosphatase 2A regulatory subunit cdc55 [Marteilia pararefringens]